MPFQSAGDVRRPWALEWIQSCVIRPRSISANLTQRFISRNERVRHGFAGRFRRTAIARRPLRASIFSGRRPFATGNDGAGVAHSASGLGAVTPAMERRRRVSGNYL